MLALLDSLVPADADRGRASIRFDPEDQGRRIRAWYERGAYTPDGDGAFDIGGATLAAVRALQEGVPADRSGSVKPNALGNGSLMRILPVALAGRRRDDATLVAWASAASAVTHGEPLPRATCALYVLLACRLLGHPDDPGAAMADARRALARHAAAAGLDGALGELLAWERRTGGGHVADAFWSAWDVVVASTSYQEAVERAVRLGNDTDTTAAIAGGLAGIRWGVGGIPQLWLARMRGREIAGELLDRLLAEAGWRTSTTSPLRVDWVPLRDAGDLAGAGGAVGMTLLPGKKRRGYGGPQWRDAAADARCLRDVHGCSTFLLLVEDIDLDISRAWGTIPALEAAGIRRGPAPHPRHGRAPRPAGLRGHPRRRSAGVCWPASGSSWHAGAASAEPGPRWPACSSTRACPRPRRSAGSGRPGRARSSGTRRRSSSGGGSAGGRTDERGTRRRRGVRERGPGGRHGTPAGPRRDRDGRRRRAASRRQGRQPGGRRRAPGSPRRLRGRRRRRRLRGRRARRARRGGDRRRAPRDRGPADRRRADRGRRARREPHRGGAGRQRNPGGGSRRGDACRAGAGCPATSCWPAARSRPRRCGPRSRPPGRPGRPAS